MQKINVIMIAHNRIDNVKQEIEVLKLFAGIEEEDIVVVDNASEDGLKQWLAQKNRLNSIICEEKMDGYALILNTAIREFDLQGDVFVLTPRFIPLPGCIEEMQRVLHSREDIGAVSGSNILSGSKEAPDFLSAVDYVRERTIRVGHDRQKLGLEPEAVLIKEEMYHAVGGFDDRLILPHSAMLDFLFQGVSLDFKLYECKDAFLFQIGSHDEAYLNEFGKDADRPVLKEKWEMNYFNDCPNYNLVSYVDRGEEEFCFLEIGCDCGVNLLEVQNKYPGAKLYGAEINPCAVKIAEHLADVKVADIEDKNLDFGEMKFDYIMFGDVLEHLRDAEGAMNYCKSLLKEGGRILACIPNLMHYTVLYELVNGNFTYQDTGLLDKSHIHFFTYNEIVKMFARCGFEMERMDSVVSSLTIKTEEAELVNNLIKVSNEAEPFMYYAYQYIVSARLVKKEN